MIIRANIRTVNDEGCEVEGEVFVHFTDLNELMHAAPESNIFVSDNDGNQWCEQKRNIIFGEVINA